MPKGSPQVFVRSRLRRAVLRTRVLQRLAQRILQATGKSRAHLSLDLIGDRRMRRLNRLYRGIDASTDVLSFPMYQLGGRGKGLGGSKKPSLPLPPSPFPPHQFLGDVVISVQTAARQAVADGQPVEQALVRLLIHGILHLRGYDHERGPREARRMRAKERAVLRSLGPLPQFCVRRQA